MSKQNLFTKKLKKQFLSINDSIESYFNKLRLFFFNLKKTKLSDNNRVILTIGIIVILTLSYFLIPTFYNKDVVEVKIKNQIFKKYNIEIKFKDKIEHGLLPKPHFSSKKISILHAGKEIANTNNLKIFIALNKFFFTTKVEVKDLTFKNTDFNIQVEDYKFFQKLLKTEPNENKIIIKNSNIFFKNKDDEVLFINKIFKSKFYYDANNLQNVLSSKNEIYNIPFKLIIKNDKFNKDIFTKFNSKKIRLNIDNTINYDSDVNEGLLDILFVNKSALLNYKIKNESMTFSSEDKKNKYNGEIFFKPFYFSANFNYEGLSTKTLFNDDTILVDLIKSEILNNKNLNANLDFNIKDITNITELNNLNLNVGLEQGNIGFSNSSVMWKNDLKIILSESLLNYNGNNEIDLIGKITIQFKDLNNFYRSFQVKKNHRKLIKDIQIDFIYNFSTKNINFDNVRIDRVQNSELEKYIDGFNKKENRNFNKITFKNFVYNFFASYAG